MEKRKAGNKGPARRNPIGVMAERSVKDRYFELLKSYVHGSDEALLPKVSHLGQEMALVNTPLEQAWEMHDGALQRLAQELPDLTLSEAVHLISAPFAEMSVVYGNAFRGELEARKQSEARYQDFYDNAPDMFASVDRSTQRIIQCNQTLATALDYRKQEIMGRPMPELYHPDCQEDRKEAARLFAETGEVSGAQLQLRRKNGSKIDVSLSALAVRDERGDTTAANQIWRDITELRDAEDTLERRIQEALAVVEIGKIVGSSLDFDLTFEQLAETISTVIPCDRLSIVIVNREQETVHITHMWSKGVGGFRRGDAYPASATLLADLRRGRGASVQNFGEVMETDPLVAQLYNEGMRSGITQPLVSGDESMGAINLHSGTVAAFHSGHMRVLEPVASQIAGSIANSRLFTGLQAAELEFEQRVQELVREVLAFLGRVNYVT